MLSAVTDNLFFRLFFQYFFKSLVGFKLFILIISSLIAVTFPLFITLPAMNNYRSRLCEVARSEAQGNLGEGGLSTRTA